MKKAKSKVSAKKSKGRTRKSTKKKLAKKKLAVKKSAAKKSTVKKIAKPKTLTNITAEATTQTLTPTELRAKIFRQLQKCLAPIAHRSPDDIHYNDKFGADYHFDAATMASLGKRLTLCFASAGMPLPGPLDSQAVEQAVYVNDVYILLCNLWGV